MMAPWPRDGGAKSRYTGVYGLPPTLKGCRHFGQNFPLVYRNGKIVPFQEMHYFFYIFLDKKYNKPVLHDPIAEARSVEQVQ